jgi:DnaJ-class molecular chaperone
MASSYHTCKNCKGTGKVQPSGEICGMCKGKGQVEVKEIKS